MLSWLRTKTKKSDPIEVTVSNRTLLHVLLMVMATFVFWLAIKRASHALLLLFTALFLSLALNAPVHKIAESLPGKSRGSRTAATALSFFAVIALLITFIASLAPPLIHQTSGFIEAAPGLVEDVRSEDTSLGRFVRRYNLQDEVQKVSDQLGDRLKNFSGSAFTTITRVGSSVFATLTVLVLTFMMLIEGPKWLEFLHKVIPDDYDQHVNRLGHDMYRVIKGYVNGQVFLAALASVMILIPLLVLNVSYPVALMVIVFICGLIPLVGHTIGAIIVGTVALFHSLPAALIIVAYYFLYQQIENYVIQPKIQANSTNMSPLLVFSSVIIGVSFGGLFGGLVAIPIAGCIRILFLDYLTTQGYLSEDTVRSEIHQKSKA
ncbi:MAG TPA: AI-2E family transporter [Patescibacteria group bacterium]|nr:AI-2E family transporter [Patescibacteria group bacterium]